MGSGTVADRIAKRVYSIAYQRALATLKEKHKEEFDTLLEAFKANVRFEMEEFGEVETTRRGPVHVAGEDGKCESCGKESPCRWQREREKRAERLAAGGGDGDVG
jgi:hypothetical protein